MNCGTTLGLTVHHIQSRGAGGTHMMDNLITLCVYCHNQAQDNIMVIGRRETVSKAKRKKLRMIIGADLKEHLSALVKGEM